MKRQLSMCVMSFFKKHPYICKKIIKSNNITSYIDRMSYQFIRELDSQVNEYTIKVNDLESELTNYIIKQLFSINQFISLSPKEKENLKMINIDFILQIDNISNNKSESNRGVNINKILLQYFNGLRTWVLSLKDYELLNLTLINNLSVKCSEYSIDLQLDILGLDIKRIKEPVLDIGCGLEAKLVSYLDSLGISVVGIDRFRSNDKRIINCDWLNFDYGINEWGCIISHMAFSNHFIHHHLKKKGQYSSYAGTYMKILKSLKKGGSFYYTPGLAFIEDLLPIDTYSVSKKAINSVDGKIDGYTTKITMI